MEVGNGAREAEPFAALRRSVDWRNKEFFAKALIYTLDEGVK